MKLAIKSCFKPLATPLHGAFSCPPTFSFSQLRLNLSHLRFENTCLDISGLFVSRYDGRAGTRHLGLDFMTAIRGTKQDANGQKMTTAQMHFGYPESSHGYFRHFKVVYSKPTDQMKVSTQ